MQRYEERKRQAEALEAREQRAREERADRLYGEPKPQGSPVEIVGVRIPFGDLVALVFAVALAQLLIFVPLAVLTYIAVSIFWPDGPRP
jgi:hypothetical protein